MKRERVMKLPVVSAAVAAVMLALLSHSGIGASSHAASATGPAAAANGAAIFGSKCAMCHGKDGAGLPNWKAKGQPDFTSADWQRSRSDAQIAESIKNGKGKFMPAFKAKLSDEEVAAVVARVRALGKK